MCNLYSLTTNQAAIAALFRVMNRYVGNLPPMPGVFPDYPAPVIRNTADGRELTMMRWGMPPPPRTGGLAGFLGIDVKDVRGFSDSSVTSIRHSRPGCSFPSRHCKACPAMTVASRHAACLSGSSSPS